MNCCGQCLNYIPRPFCENICAKTGRIAPYMDVKSCFEPKINKEIKTEKKMETQDTITTKVCRTCGRELPVSEFGHHHLTKDGYNPDCRECRSKRMKDRKAVITQEFENSIAQLEDQALVDELRERGYEVTCKKTIEL